MCGRYTLLVSAADLAEHCGLAERAPVVPRYNVAPTQPVLAVGLSRDGRPAAATFRWGIIPPWATDPKPGSINARAETVASKPTFAEAFRRRRCLIPADGFYEWAKPAGPAQAAVALPAVGRRPVRVRGAVGGVAAGGGAAPADVRLVDHRGA